MDNKPQVTIIIPAYNMIEYIDQCMESVTKQSFKRFKVLIIDDGSIDATFEKCLEWEKNDSRIKAYKKEHEGQGPAREYLLKFVDTEYVTFLDADDSVSPFFLEEMLKATNGGKIDLVLCDMMFVFVSQDRINEKISKLRFTEGEVDITKEKFYLSKSRNFVAGKLVRTEIIKESGFRQPAHPFEDVATMAYLVSKAKSISYVNKPLYRYLRNREGSTINHFDALGYTAISLGELLNSFKKDGSFDRFRDELCYLYWGQVCHVWKVTAGKFSDDNKIKIEQTRKDILNEFKRIFPELKNIDKYKYYIDIEDERYKTIIDSAVRNLSIEENPFGDNVTGADIIIGFKDIEDVDFNEDMETVVWNASDRIFEKIEACMFK